MMLTVVAKDSFGFLVFCGRNERSYEHVHYGHQQDNQQNKLGLWRAETVRVIPLDLCWASREQNEGCGSHFGFPFHPGHGDAQQQNHRYTADDPDVV